VKGSKVRLAVDGRLQHVIKDLLQVEFSGQMWFVHVSDIDCGLD